MSIHKIVDDREGLFQQGVDLSRQGNYTAAIQSFDRALAQDPDRADAYGHRCVARHRTGDPQGAIADCHAAAKLYLAQGLIKEHQYALKMLHKLQA